MYRNVKRAIDGLASAVALLLLAPLLLFIAARVKASSPGDVIFRQTRVGKDGRMFTIYKFRTMYETAPHMTPTHALKHAHRHTTRVGRRLRALGLDELPQLINVLKGDMSLVGPRPALPGQTDLLTLRESCGANSVRPGLTGWAQVNGRNEIPIAVKARLDGEYVASLGFAMDAKCVLLTLFGSKKHPLRFSEGRRV